MKEDIKELYIYIIKKKAKIEKEKDFYFYFTHHYNGEQHLIFGKANYNNMIDKYSIK